MTGVAPLADPIGSREQRGNSRRLPGRSLWWKELRLLATVALPLVAIEVGVLLAAWGILDQADTSSAGDLSLDDLLAWSLGLWALLLGALGFGLDREARVLPWLSELPISPWATLGTKGGVAALALLGLLLERQWVLGQGLPADGWETARLLAGGALAYLAGGWFGLADLRRWLARSLVLALLVGWWWLGSSTAMARLPVLLLALALCGGAAGVFSIQRLLRFPDFGATPSKGRSESHDRAPRRAGRRHLAWLERQLYQRTWWLGALAPVLLALTPDARRLPWLFFFPIPFLTAWNGAGLVADGERDGTGFLLHHLPIPHRRIYGRRLLGALALGPVLVLEASVFAWLCHRLGTTDPLWQPASILPTLGWVMALLALLSTLVAAALSPWIPERALSTVLSLLTVVLLAITSDVLAGPLVLLGFVAVLVALGVLAIWGCSPRMAFTSLGGSPKRRWLAITILVGCWFGLLALRSF